MPFHPAYPLKSDHLFLSYIWPSLSTRHRWSTDPTIGWFTIFADAICAHLQAYCYIQDVPPTDQAKSADKFPNPFPLAVKKKRKMQKNKIPQVFKKQSRK